MRFLLIATPLLPLLAAVPGGRWLLPLLAPLVLYPSFRERVAARDYSAAWGLTMLWAFLLSAGVVLLTWLWPEAARDGIWNGETYRAEMFGWIATGAGREADWRASLPQHLLHLAAFLVLTYVSAGYLGLALGAALVAYMSYFVGSYAAASGAPLLGAVAAWVPWSVVRVAAFVLLGCLLARPLLVRRPWPFERREARLFALGFAGIVADVLLKAALARPYGIFLRELARGILLGH